MAASSLFVYIKLSGSDPGGCQVAHEVLDAQGNVVTAKSAYDTVPTFSDSTGYQFRHVLSAIGVRERLYIHATSNPNQEAQVVIDRPTADLARKQVYPPTGSSDLKTPYNYTGVKSGGLPSNNTGVVNLSFDFVNGRITNLRPNNQQGGTVVMKLSNHIYRWDGSNWYRVNDVTGATSGSAVAFSLSPQYGLLDNTFLVDTKRPINGSDNVPGWFDQPVTVGTQLLRVL